MNRAYINASGKNARTDVVGRKLNVDPKYIQETISIVTENLELLLEQFLKSTQIILL